MPAFRHSTRKKFIGDAMKIAGAAALLSSPVFSRAIPAIHSRKYTVQDIIDIIIKEVPNAPFVQTVDTIKSGSASQEVKSVATTMFATVDLIRKAAEIGVNFIIAHEPTFYNHEDNKKWVSKPGVVDEKVALLNKHGICVWRFHDYCHALKPDAISYGVARKAGWLNYYKTGERILTVPSMTLNKLVHHLKSSLNIKHLRVIGDLEQPCSKLALMPGAWGGQAQMLTAEEQHPDVMIVGEVHEWETAEYIRDARALGVKSSLIILGHGVSEEPGMEWVAEWLKPKIQGVPIVHLPSGDPFIWI